MRTRKSRPLERRNRRVSGHDVASTQPKGINLQFKTLTTSRAGGGNASTITRNNQLTKHRIMVYRAKITNIVSWVERHYNTNIYHIVKDSKDKYIEVKDIAEADFIEMMNTTAENYNKAREAWSKRYSGRTSE